MFRVDLLLILSTFLLTRGLSVLLFPRNSVLQITFGLSTPIELNLKDRAIVYSLGLQLQYLLPKNITELQPTVIPARSSRDLTLQDTYDTMEKLLAENGWNDGRECLLRSICELAETPLERDGQDFVEEVIHLLLTCCCQYKSIISRDTLGYLIVPNFSGPIMQIGRPSEDLPEAFDSNHQSVHEMYHEAERLGGAGKDCIFAYPNCIKSPLESFTEILRADRQ